MPSSHRYVVADVFTDRPLEGTSFRFWAPLLGGFVIAWPFAFAVNRATIRRGKGHAAAHAHH